MKKNIIKIIVAIFSLAMIMTIVGTNINDTVVADSGNYPIACGNDFEVSKITDDGKFTKESCYSTLEAAEKRMNELGKEYVVRHETSKSATKIVAMVSGVVYATPRMNSSTINIYNKVNTSGNVKTTYISGGYEMNYEYTYSYHTSGQYVSDGYVKVKMNGFDGYVDLINVDMVPDKFFEKGLAIELGGNEYGGAASKAVIPSRNYYIVEKNGNYRDLVYYAYYSYPQGGQSGAKASYAKYTIGPAPLEMKDNTKYYSANGYDFYTDPALKNYAFEHYSYYQFLPLRSKSNLSAADLNNALIYAKGSNTNSVLKDQGNAFIEAQEKYGVNALLLYAMACHESSWGTSGYAINRNNLFGWSAFDADPDQASYFDSVYQCVTEMAGVNLRGYLDITDWRYFSSSLGNKGSGFNVKYASDPYWGMSIASVAYSIDKISNGFNGNLSDYEQYDLAVIDTYNTPLKAAADASSATYYNATYGSNYLDSFVVIVLGTVGDYTKIQFTNPVNTSGMITTSTSGLEEYDFDCSVAYVLTKDIHMIYGTADKEPSNPSDPTNPNSMDILAIDSFELKNDGSAYIEGVAFTTFVNYNNKNNISMKLGVYDLTTNKLLSSYDLNVSESGYDLADGYDYTYSRFSGDIDFSELDNGNYSFKIIVKNNNFTREYIVKASALKYANQSAKVNDTLYYLNTNIIYNTRFELEVSNLPFDYTLINKPSVQKSLLSYNEIRIDNGILYIDGYAYIQYADFGKDDNTNFELYLVDIDGKTVKMNTNKKECAYDLTGSTGGKYDLGDACFEASYDVANLDAGDYDIYMVLSSDEYYDVYFFTDRRQYISGEYESGNKNYELNVSNDRYKIKLNVEDKN